MKPSVSYQEKPRKSVKTTSSSPLTSSSSSSTTTSNQFPKAFIRNYGNDKIERDHNQYLTSSDDKYSNLPENRHVNDKNGGVIEAISEEIADSLIISVLHRRVSTPELNDLNEIRMIEENIRENERLALRTDELYNFSNLTFDIDDGNLADIEDN